MFMRVNSQCGHQGAMTASKSLPARPSLESLRKQAKKFARDTAAGDAAAIARARAHLPSVDLPLTQRNAQLVIAREYGYAGWQDLGAEVSTRLGKGLEWAAAQARRIIHDHDVERLKQLLAEYPALLSWRVAAYRLAWTLAPPLGPLSGPLPRTSPVETSLTQSEPLPL